VLRDDSEAARWWRLAGYQGHLNAQFNLGFMYEHGQGVTSDDIEAAKWYRLAAGQGDLDAMRNLAIVIDERENQLKNKRYHLGGSDMSESPTDWFGETMHSILGLGETMTPADIGLIALVVLVIMVPVVMPFSFYRIKPLMQKLSDDAAMRDQALLGELRSMTAVLQQQATAAAESDKAQTEELRKITRALDAEVERHEATGGSPAQD
jgi:TPR repeat protein